MTTFDVCPRCGQTVNEADGAVVVPFCSRRPTGSCALCGALLEAPPVVSPEARALLERDLAWVARSARPAARKMRPGQFW